MSGAGVGGAAAIVRAVSALWPAAAAYVEAYVDIDGELGAAVNGTAAGDDGGGGGSSSVQGVAAGLVPGALLRAGQGLGWLAAAVMDHGVHMCFFVSVLFTALSAKRDLLDDAVGAVAAPLQLRDARRRQLVRALRGCIEGVLFVPLQVRA